MRITVELPPAVYRRVQQLAASRGESLSQTIVDLTIRGLDQIDSAKEFPTLGGVPGHVVTDERVAQYRDDE